jgi:hypothetical protein
VVADVAQLVNAVAGMRCQKTHTNRPSPTTNLKNTSGKPKPCGMIAAPVLEQMIKIDFYPGTHGNFLEYVTNVYIMQTNPGKTGLIDSLGAAHDVDVEYQRERVVYNHHYSLFDEPFAEDDTVIRITANVDDDEMWFIALTNCIHRAGNIGFETRILEVPEEVRAIPAQHRNNWYAKFNERETYTGYQKWQAAPGAVFDFPFSDFYSFPTFCKRLNSLAGFLDQTFFPDARLYQLWNELMGKNQGLQSYNKCHKILDAVYANQSYKIDCDIIEQAWINYNLSKSVRMYSGSVFDNDEFPNDAQLIYAEIQQHLKHLR